MGKPWQPIFDSLANLITGLGVAGRDKNVASTYTFNVLTRAELDAAYRGDWVARKCVDIPAQDCTREWREWQADQSDIGKIEDAEKTFGLQRKLKRAMIRARLYGGGALLMGFGDDDPRKPIDPLTVKQGGLKYIHYFSNNELTAGQLNMDIEDEWFHEPTYYMLSSSGNTKQVQIHPSRVIRLVGGELPNAYLSSMPNAGWGDSIVQVIDEAVKNVALTSQGVAALVHEAKLDIIKMPDLAAQVSTQEYRDRLISRMQLMNVAKSLVGVTLLDEKDNWDRKEISFASLPDIVKLYLMIASGASDIPATRLLGQSPQGMNATGDSDTRNYYDRLRAEQTTEMTPTMERLDKVLLMSTFGTLPDGMWYEWRPLWQQSEEEKAKTSYSKAQTFQIDFTAGLIPEEALRQGRENQLIEDGVYPGLEQAIEDAELLQEQALNELDPAVAEQARQHLLAQQAGLPPIPLLTGPQPGAPGSQPGGPGAAPGPGLGASPQPKQLPPPRKAGDASPRDRDGTFALGLTPGEARRRGLKGYVKGRDARRKTAQAFSEAGWIAGGMVTPHGANILGAWADRRKAKDAAPVDPAIAAIGDQLKALMGRLDAQDQGATDSIPKSLYVRRDVVNADEITAWATEQGFTDIVADLHVTITYSKQPVDWMKAGNDTGWGPNGKDDGTLLIPPGGPRVIEPLGNDGAVVLMFSSTALQWRHGDIERCTGALYEYDEYQPHITIAYGGAPANLDMIDPYRGAIELGPEIFEEIDVNPYAVSQEAD